MTIYDNGEVAVEVSEHSARIMVMGTSKPVYLTLPELVGIAEAIIAHFAEPLFTEEDLEAGRQAIAGYIEAP